MAAEVRHRSPDLPDRVLCRRQNLEHIYRIPIEANSTNIMWKWEASETEQISTWMDEGSTATIASYGLGISTPPHLDPRSFSDGRFTENLGSGLFVGYGLPISFGRSRTPRTTVSKFDWLGEF